MKELHRTSFSRRSFLRLSGTIAVGSALAPLTALGGGRMREIRRAGFTMGSIVTVTAYSRDEVLCNRAIDAAFREMKWVDTLMSVYNPASELSRVNREGAKREVTVDPAILDVLTQAQLFHRLTGGAFDVTIEPLMELYGFRDEAENIPFPSDHEIAATLDAVGMRNVEIDARRLSIALHHSKTELDFGGIAVGYALDKAAACLRSYGIESALINHSGDLYALGAPPDAGAWDVSITDPDTPEETITTVKIADQALSTSGNYQNYKRSGERTIGHILNPATALSPTSMLSATVIARTACEADALSTGCFVMGVERTREIMANLKGVEVHAVVRRGAGEDVVRVVSQS